MWEAPYLWRHGSGTKLCRRARLVSGLTSRYSLTTVCFASTLCLVPVQGFVKDRPTLLDIATAGPLWGTAASTALLVVGLGLTVAGLGDITIDSPAFADSFIVGLLGQFVLGDALANPEVREAHTSGAFLG